MTTMFVRHKVGDYGKWKAVYDRFGPTRKAKGVTAASLHRDSSDPDTVFITHQFRDTKAATDFASSEELKTAMANAGVMGAPEIWFAEDIEQTPY